MAQPWMSRIFFCYFFTEAGTKAHLFRGKGHRLHLLIGEWQGAGSVHGVGNIVVACTGLNGVFQNSRLPPLILAPKCLLLCLLLCGPVSTLDSTH